MQRRTFLRVLGSAIIGAAIAPSLPALLHAHESSGGAYTVSTAGPLTYDMLRRAYESCVLGREAPSLVVMSCATARHLGLVYDVEV